MKSVSSPKNGPFAMHRVKAFRFAFGQVLQTHRFDGEACRFDARENLARRASAPRRRA
jgi:hypothetical protein